MVRDGILYIDFRLLILLICWLCKEMLGGSTAQSRLAFPLETLEVLLCLEIPWYKEKKIHKDLVPVVIIQVPGEKLSKNNIGSLYSFIQVCFL